MPKIKNADLKRRIIEISYKHNLSHLGSCLTAVDIIDEIYATKKPLTFKAWDEPFILSAGHAGLALYVVIEKYYGKDAEEIFLHHGVHPDRCRQCYIYCSTGSLGQGLPIAVGIALANREKNVYCLISDGESKEGSIYEALMVRMKYNLHNLKVYLNQNHWGAYDYIHHREVQVLEKIPKAKIKHHYTNTHDFPFLKGQDAHYYTMKKEDYETALRILA